MNKLILDFATICPVQNENELPDMWKQYKEQSEDVKKKVEFVLFRHLGSAQLLQRLEVVAVVFRDEAYLIKNRFGLNGVTPAYKVQMM